MLPFLGRAASTQAADGPLRVPAAALMKRLRKRVSPAYPSIARGMKVRGVVRLDAVIGRNGVVETVQPLEGPRVLQNAARKALAQWRFRPVFVEGEPTRVVSTFQFRFDP